MATEVVVVVVVSEVRSTVCLSTTVSVIATQSLTPLHVAHHLGVRLPTSPPPAQGEPRVSPEPASARNLHDLSTRIPAQGGPRTTRESGCCLKSGKGSGHASDGKLQRGFFLFLQSRRRRRGSVSTK